MANRLKGNVLVTGGSGFIGSHIVEALREENQRQIVVYDIAVKDRDDRNVVSIHGDVFDYDNLLYVLHEYEIRTIIHMVGLASIPDCAKEPDSSFRLNVSSVHSILEAMRLRDVKRLVFPSTAAVYGATNGPQVDETTVSNPSTVYGCHKRAAEMLIRGYAENYGFDPTTLRIFNVYGDLDKEQGMISQSLRKTMAGDPIIVKGGGQLRDFVLLSDVVEAFVKSLNGTACNGRTMNVGSGVGVSIREIAEMIRRRFPDAEILYEPTLQGEYSIYANVSRMKRLLGFVATSPKVGIPRFIEACWRERGLVAGSPS